MKLIKSPNPDFSGEVVGVLFQNGEAVVEELTPTQVDYFERQGYVLEGESAE
jgi:hypothetical protein